jgi:hypothetical protein
MRGGGGSEIRKDFRNSRIAPPRSEHLLGVKRVSLLLGFCAEPQLGGEIR